MQHPLFGHSKRNTPFLFRKATKRGLGVASRISFLRGVPGLRAPGECPAKSLCGIIFTPVFFRRAFLCRRESPPACLAFPAGATERAVAFPLFLPGEGGRCAGGAVFREPPGFLPLPGGPQRVPPCIAPSPGKGRPAVTEHRGNKKALLRGTPGFLLETMGRTGADEFLYAGRGEFPPPFPGG